MTGQLFDYLMQKIWISKRIERVHEGTLYNPMERRTILMNNLYVATQDTTQHKSNI